MPNQPQLLDYVKQQRVAGVSDQIIQQNLVASGWSTVDIAAALSNNQVQTSTTSAATASPFLKKSLTILSYIVGGLVVVGVGAFYFISHQSLSQTASENYPDISSQQQTQVQEQTTSTVQPAANIPVQATSTQRSETQRPTTGSTKTAVQKSTETAASVPTPAASTVMLQCSGMKISVPKSWADLPPAKSSQLGADGCYRDNMGCLCAKQDPSDPSQNVMFSVLITEPPSGFTLNDSLPKGTSDTKNINFLGFSAIQFTTPGAKRIGGINFFKGQDIYSLTFSAKSDTFSKMWPDVLAAMQGSKF